MTPWIGFAVADIVVAKQRDLLATGANLCPIR
jgi:hypothetical protein